jgi:hypothetical protein
MLKKLILIVILIVLCNKVQNSIAESLFIHESEAINPIENLIYAIGMVEGRCDTLAYNPVEDAVGYFQIRPIRLRDYNRRTGKNYKLKDMYDFETAKEVFMYYADKIGEDDLERIAKNWNGSGPMTKIYWNKVKVYL